MNPSKKSTARNFILTLIVGILIIAILVVALVGIIDGFKSNALAIQTTECKLEPYGKDLPAPNAIQRRS